MNGVGAPGKPQNYPCRGGLLEPVMAVSNTQCRYEYSPAEGKLQVSMDRPPAPILKAIGQVKVIELSSELSLHYFLFCRFVVSLGILAATRLADHVS